MGLDGRQGRAVNNNNVEERNEGNSIVYHDASEAEIRPETQTPEVRLRQGFRDDGELILGLGSVAQTYIFLSSRIR